MKPTPPSSNSCFVTVFKFAFGCVTVIGAVYWLMNRYMASGYVVKCGSDADGIRCGKMFDKPWVLTHLQVGGAFGVLEPPLARVESGSIRVSNEKLRKMKWFSDTGEETSAPTSYEDARAIYHFPERSERKSSDE
jgi:hypothetical protein